MNRLRRGFQENYWLGYITQFFKDLDLWGKGKNGEKRNATPFFQQAVIFPSTQWGGCIFPFQMGSELLVGSAGYSITVENTVRINCRNGAPTSHLVWCRWHFLNPRTLIKSNKVEHTLQRGVQAAANRCSLTPIWKATLLAPVMGLEEQFVIYCLCPLAKYQSLKWSKSPQKTCFHSAAEVRTPATTSRD